LSAQAADRTDTKERILDAAERLFESHGFAGTSLRAITSRAGANVAAVHYHFGSREALLRAVLARRIEPINRARLTRLATLEARAETTLEEILEAFLAPALEGFDADASYARLPGLILQEPAEQARALVEELFGEVARRFHAALARRLPHLESGEVLERLRFAVGVLVHHLAGIDPLLFDQGRPVGRARRRRLLADMVAFLAAGFRAPSAHGARA
jgi:AcrR family transcriptional regulator